MHEAEMAGAQQPILSPRKPYCSGNVLVTFKLASEAR